MADRCKNARWFAFARLLLNDSRCVFEGLPHPPSERNSNRPPSDEGLGIETAPADSIRALRPKSLAAHSDLKGMFVRHMPLRVDRPNQRIANESGDQEAGKNLKDKVVDIIARNALGHARVMQVIDDHRADDSRR